LRITTTKNKYPPNTKINKTTINNVYSKYKNTDICQMPQNVTIYNNIYSQNTQITQNKITIIYQS